MMMPRSIVSSLFLLILVVFCSLSVTFAAMTRNEALRELGLKNSKATEAEIKKAYRKRSLETHPDKGGSNEEFVRVAEAYQVLTGGGGGAGGGDGSGGGFGGFDFNMSDDEKVRMANDMFFQMFDEFLTDTDAAADKLVDWVFDFFEDAEFEKTQEGSQTKWQYKGQKEKSEDEKKKPKKDGMWKSMVRWGARKSIKFLQGVMEGDNTVMTINGQQMTGADFKRFREQAQQRVQQRKMASGGGEKAAKDSGEF